MNYKEETLEEKLVMTPKMKIILSLIKLSLMVFFSVLMINAYLNFHEVQTISLIVAAYFILKAVKYCVDMIIVMSVNE